MIYHARGMRRGARCISRSMPLRYHSAYTPPLSHPRKFAGSSTTVGGILILWRVPTKKTKGENRDGNRYLPPSIHHLTEQADQMTVLPSRGFRHAEYLTRDICVRQRHCRGPPSKKARRIKKGHPKAAYFGSTGKPCIVFTPVFAAKFLRFISKSGFQKTPH